MSAMVSIDQDVGQTTGRFFWAIETEQASVHRTRSVFAARNGVRQPAGRAVTRRAAIRRVGLLDASAVTQLALGPAALIDIVDHQRAAQGAQPSRGEQGHGERVF